MVVAGTLPIDPLYDPKTQSTKKRKVYKMTLSFSCLATLKKRMFVSFFLYDRSCFALMHPHKDEIRKDECASHVVLSGGAARHKVSQTFNQIHNFFTTVCVHSCETLCIGLKIL